MDTLDTRLAALADPTRRALIQRLAQGEATVAELCQPFGISQPAISRHLKVLEQAGLIETRIEGTARPRRLRHQAIAETAAWFGPFLATLDARFRALDQVLAAMPDLPTERKDP
ncbi:winged helix-turn-helix transcriptional regulator [Paracoccus sp. M683]|uniref:ArsR/SmtB family transcription factor n=1 Tax=Paracoccus sp. M683 TaxID=2594268 RepID=UPI00117DA81D|nr:metalloregulator ArsR/SmtB family transcription factor [Paracoccus sp. M683]TRW97232.1 winged helix-turn-helix transcriptional regulator [Paracoccus sp. M683]